MRLSGYFKAWVSSIGVKDLAIVIIFTPIGMLYGIPGFFLALLATACAILSFRSQQRLVKFSFLALSAVTVWFLTVHRVYRFSSCRICDYTVEQYSALEILTIPVVSETRTSWNMIYPLMNDFGCPCKHSQMPPGYPLDDWWGLVYRHHPVLGTYGGWGDMEAEGAWYEKEVRPKILQLKKDRPDLAAEFCRRVAQRDNKYLFEFHDKVMVEMLGIRESE